MTAAGSQVARGSMELKSLRTKAETMDPCLMGGAGSVYRVHGTVSPPLNTERGLMPAQRGKTGAEEHLTGEGGQTGPFEV